MTRLQLIIVVAIITGQCALAGAQPATTKPSTQPILEYFRGITLTDYNRIGSRNAEWDEPARETLEALANVLAFDFRTDGDEYDVIMADTNRLNAAGCSDPLVLFARARGQAYFSRRLEDFMVMHVEAARRISESAYDPLLKCMVNLQAAGVRARDRTDTHTSRRDARRLVEAGMASLPRVLGDPDVPDEVLLDLFDLIGDTSYLVERDRAIVFNRAIALVELSKTPRAAGIVMTARAEFGLNYALDTARDTKADPKETAKQRSERLAAAAEAGEQAWRVDPTAAHAAEVMMQIEAARSAPRQTIEMWFARVILADPARYSAYFARLKLLEPAKGGDTREMIDFGRQCLRTAPGDSGMALLLVDAHVRASHFTDAGEQEEMRRDYFTSSGRVWEDINAAYGPYVARYPDSQFHRSRFAQLAAWCGQWQTADAQLKAMGDRQFSLSWFRSKDTYLRLRSEINEHVRAASQPAK